MTLSIEQPAERRTTAKTDKPEAALSARQIEVIRLRSEGLPIKEIAERLSIRWKTVEVHLYQARKRGWVNGQSHRDQIEDHPAGDTKAQPVQRPYLHPTRELHRTAWLSPETLEEQRLPDGTYPPGVAEALAHRAELLEAVTSGRFADYLVRRFDERGEV